jgi:acid phosphatase
MNRTARRRHFMGAALLAAVLVTALTTVPALAFAADCPAPREPQLGEVPKPLNIDKIKELLRDYHDKSYDADLAAVAGDAQAYVERRAKDAKNPALVLDIDETSLTNWPNIDADDFGFIPHGRCPLQKGFPCGFDAWVRKGTAKPIAPTLKVFNAARQNGVTVFFITGRRQNTHWVTITNLTRAGFYGWKRLVLRPLDDSGTVGAFKSKEREKLEAEGYTIIANMGDQLSDLEGGHAECGFKLPNPFYFIK